MPVHTILGMAPSTIKNSAESPIFKWGQFIVSVVLVPVILRANDSLEDIKKSQQAQATHMAVLDEQVSSMRALIPQRNAQFAEINSSLVDLKDKALTADFRLTNVESWQKFMTRRAP